MKTTAAELSSYKAIVKAIGVYQLVLGFASLYQLVLGKIGFAFAHGPDWQQHVAWDIFEFSTALVLLFGTDTFCRLAYRPSELAQPHSNEI